MKPTLLATTAALALAIAAAYGPALAGGNGIGVGVGVSVGGAGGVSAGAGASAGSGGIGAGVGASVGGTNGINAGLGVSVGGAPGTSNSGDLGNDGIGSLASMEPGSLRSTLGRLSASDISKLKIACEDVLANPSAYSADMRAVCAVIASI